MTLKIVISLIMPPVKMIDLTSLLVHARMCHTWTYLNKDRKSISIFFCSVILKNDMCGPNEVDKDPF